MHKRKSQGKDYSQTSLKMRGDTTVLILQQTTNKLLLLHVGIQSKLYQAIVKNEGENYLHGQTPSRRGSRDADICWRREIIIFKKHAGRNDSVLKIFLYFLLLKNLGSFGNGDLILRIFTVVRKEKMTDLQIFRGLSECEV